MPAIVNTHTAAAAAAPKTDTVKSCSVSFDEFCRNATPQALTIGQGTVRAKPNDWGEGKSFGWDGRGKVDVKLANGQVVRCQVEIKLYVVNSKTEARTTSTGPMTDEQVDAAEKRDAADVE